MDNIFLSKTDISPGRPDKDYVKGGTSKGWLKMTTRQLINETIEDCIEEGIIFSDYDFEVTIKVKPKER